MGDGCDNQLRSPKYVVATEHHTTSDNREQAYEEITVMKTEIKEEVADFDMIDIKDENNFETINDYSEYVNVKVDPENKDEENNLKEEIFNYASCDMKISDAKDYDNHTTIWANPDTLSSDHRKKMVTTVEVQNKGRFKCPHCDNNHVSKDALKKHIKLYKVLKCDKKKGNDRKHECPLCHKSYPRSDNLTRHIKIKHSNSEKQQKYQCNDCPYKANLKFHLKEHIRRKHSSVEKNNKCNNCSYVTHSISDLKCHIRSHVDEKPFSCNYVNCGYKTKRKDNLRRHITASHSKKTMNQSDVEKKYKCERCEYSSHRKERLGRHVRFHRTEEKEMFKCSFENCCYQCKTATTLTKHILNYHRKC